MGDRTLAQVLRRSLTAKMLVAVGLTVAVVIAIYSFFVIRIQSAWWHERTQAQNRLTASMVHEYIVGVMLSRHHEEVKNLLQELKKSDEVWRGRVLRSDGRVSFSTDTQEIHQVTLPLPRELTNDLHTVYGMRVEDGQRLAVLMTPVRHHERCQGCHQPKGKMLGAIMLEKSMRPVEASIASNRNLLIVYGVIIFVLVGVVLWLLIVRMVSQPVEGLLQQMHRVREGDLQARAESERTDEIGQLEQGFNAMVDSLEAAKRQLHESHEKQIQQAGKLASIGELASGIAHEIRNPLAGIGSAVEVLSEIGGANGQYAEVVAEIRRQIARLNGALCDLLDFARPREPEIAPSAVSEVIKPMLALIKADAQKQRIRIVEEYPAELPPISVDTKLMQQAVLNILLNAVQAMPGGGTLAVRVEVVNKTLLPEHDRTVRISIRDSGCGIPSENMQKIFSPFFTTKHRGTGLGLSITRTIIEKHGGTLDVESEPGRGTAFTMEFAACHPSLLGGPKVAAHSTQR